MHYKQKTFMEKSNEQLKTKIKLYLDEYVTLYMGGLDGKDARFNYLYNRMQKTLEDLFLRLKIEFEQSEFEPWKYELEITKTGEVKPFKVQLDDGYVELGGIVDRVDKMDVEGKRYIRVVDYKTGSKEFELCEVLHGLNMQMLLYLMAIWKSDEKEYKDSVPAGILYFPARSEMYSAKRGEDDDKKLDNRLKANCKMNGMILDDETVIDGMDKSGEYKLIPLSINKRTKGVKGNLINLTQLGKLSLKMDEIIREMGEGLHAGKVDALPIKIGTGERVCTFCDYRSVCLKEKDAEVKQISKISHDSTLKILQEEGEKDEQEMD
ncbi:MAG: PD-(D/E)XK nuclease family protein, partial [Clostridia bacterium]